MQSLGMGQAINQALREEMQRDKDVFLAGEGVGVGIHSSPMLPTAGLNEKGIFSALFAYIKWFQTTQLLGIR